MVQVFQDMLVTKLQGTLLRQVVKVGPGPGEKFEATKAEITSFVGKWKKCIGAVEPKWQDYVPACLVGEVLVIINMKRR